MEDIERRGDIVENGNGNNNSYHKKRARILFWAAALATLFQLTLLSLEALGIRDGKVSLEMTLFYFAILVTYSSQNMIVTWKNPDDKYRGEIFVFVVWLFTNLMYLCVFLKFFKNVPGELAHTWGGVTTLFFSTNVSKVARDLIFKKRE